METTERNRARENAQAHLDNIRELFAAINALESGVDEDGNDIESITVDGETFDDAQDIFDRLREIPLSVQVRSGWQDVGESLNEPVEFEILLTTGGPALRIRGDLWLHGEPSRAYMQYQDWGTPWTNFFADTEGMGALLLRFARVFYYGE